MSHFSGIVLVPQRTVNSRKNGTIERYVARKLRPFDENKWLTKANEAAKWDYYSIDERWADDFLHAGRDDFGSNGVFDRMASLKRILNGLQKDQLHTPFCIVDLDGTWHERATMGWFCATHNENPNWREDAIRVAKLTLDAEEDAWGVFCDFHI